MARYVLDTNILSAIARKRPALLARIDEALAAGHEFIMCPMAFFEVHRGLLFRDAKGQRDFLLSYSAKFTWSDFNPFDWQAAAALWADLRRNGIQVEDADLLISVYVLQRGAILITDDQHFRQLGTDSQNWLR